MSTLCTSKIAYLYELKALCRIKILNVFQITKGTLRSARKEDAVATIPFLVKNPSPPWSSAAAAEAEEKKLEFYNLYMFLISFPEK